ncbi:MAG: iron ABC transporter permease, partial [Gammaproteobacteria bacterium]
MERFLNPALLLLLLMVAILSLDIGILDLEAGSALIDWCSSLLSGEALTREALIVGEIRLPRTLLAL